MARTKKSGSPSPWLKPRITAEQFARAKRSNSGGCLVADAIKAQYPQYGRVEVDMATVQIWDYKRGERYVYLTPPSVANVLLGFDQGWPVAIDAPLHIRRAVQILPIRRAASGAHSTGAVRERRRERIAELEQKQEAGEDLTSGEKRSLTQLKNNEAAPPPPERPTSHGPAQVVEQPPASKERPTIRGGRPPIKPPRNPNLLAGRNRHFGAKLADPGLAFREAVAQAVADHLAEQESEPVASS